MPFVVLGQRPECSGIFLVSAIRYTGGTFALGWDDLVVVGVKGVMCLGYDVVVFGPLATAVFFGGFVDVAAMLDCF